MLRPAPSLAASASRSARSPERREAHRALLPTRPPGTIAGLPRQAAPHESAREASSPWELSADSPSEGSGRCPLHHPPHAAPSSSSSLREPYLLAQHPISEPACFPLPPTGHPSFSRDPGSPFPSITTRSGTGSKGVSLTCPCENRAPITATEWTDFVRTQCTCVRSRRETLLLKDMVGGLAGDPEAPRSPE